jgi:hypothetical protein
MNSQVGGVQEPTTRRMWSALSARQLGRYGGRLAHLEFSAHGFDVYLPDVDDRSVDFVVRSAELRASRTRWPGSRRNLGDRQQGRLIGARPAPVLTYPK